MKNTLLLLLISILVTGCLVSQDSNTSDEERILTGNLSREVIQKLEEDAAGLPNIFSYLVMYRDTIVTEKYFNGKKESSLLHIRSITKSISSTLLGIAIDKGHIENLNESILSYYPAYTDVNDPLQDSISVQHILDMQSGFNWNENTEAINWYTSISQPTEYIFSKEVTDQPGTVWNYNSGAVHLLGEVFIQNTNQSLNEFAADELFTPLNIQNYTWDKDPKGKVRPDAGLALMPKDLLNIGRMIIHDGTFETNSVISENWLENSFQTKINLNSTYGPIQELHYNNLWWLGFYDDYKVMFGLGYGGQLLLMIPELELVIVVNHEYMLPGNVASQQARTFLNTIFVPLMDHFISTIKS